MDNPNQNTFFKKILKQVFLEWMSGSFTLDHVLDGIFREHRVGSRERFFISSLSYLGIRHWSVFFSKPLKPESSREDYMVLDSELEHYIEKLSEKKWNLLQEQLEKKHKKVSPRFADNWRNHLSLHHGLDEQRGGALLRTPEALHQYLHDSLEEAPLTIRLNTLKISREDFMKQYPQAQASSYLPNAFHFESRWALTQEDLYQSGAFEIQDESSQWVVHSLAPQPGTKILDLCAGAGGKTLQMASQMQGQGEVWAYDISKPKLSQLLQRARRADLNNVRVLEKIPEKQKFDIVLVDVPCSRWGTLRRCPDIILKSSLEGIQKYELVQKELLQLAKNFVNEKGLLCYATCTIRPEENIEQWQRFLNNSGKEWTPCFPPNTAKDEKFLTVLEHSSAFKMGPSLSDSMKWGCLQIGPMSQGLVSHSESHSFRGDGFFVAWARRR